MIWVYVLGFKKNTKRKNYAPLWILPTLVTPHAYIKIGTHIALETSLDYESSAPITDEPKFKADSVLKSCETLLENCTANGESYTAF